MPRGHELLAAAMAHQTDEYCNMERIRQSVAIYEAIIRDWCGA